MFCAKCGAPTFTKFCAKCGAKTTKKRRSVMTIVALLTMIALFLLLVIGILVKNSNLPDKIVLQNWLGYSFLFCLFILVILLVFKFFKTLISNIKSIKERPVAGTCSGLFILGLISLSVWGVISVLSSSISFVSSSRHENLYDSLSLVQDTLAEIAATKEIGDLLAINKTPPQNYTWQEVKNLSTSLVSQIDSLKVDGRLTEYKTAAAAWAEKIRAAANNQKTWKDLPPAPESFVLKFGTSDAEELFQHSLADIVELTQFGSDAIRRKDRETMRYVAAKLLVQGHWLANLANNKTGIFSGLIKTAYAQENHPEDKWQAERAHASVLMLMNAAQAYYFGKNIEKDKTAAESWNKATEDWAKVIAENDLAPLVLAELIKNAKKEPPAQIKVFKDGCSAKEGVLSGINRANEWLQTAEDGFYCRYEEDGKKCWNSLSFSGGMADGGDIDCEQKNVLLTPIGPNKALAKTRPPKPQPVVPAPATKTETQPAQQTQTATPVPAKEPLRDPGQPTGTAAPKIEFTVSQSNFAATVGEHFSYSFCQPTVTRTSDLCTAASTNPRYGLPPYTFSLEPGVGFLPYGLTLNLNGLLAGIPTAAGSRTVGICAKDTGGFSVCRRITVNIEPKEEIFTYDGSYTATCNISCRDCYSERSWPFGETYYHVSKNAVIDAYGGMATVSASGAAQIVRDSSGTHHVTTINFSGNEEQMRIDSTDISTTVYDGCTETCQITCSGYRYSR